MNDDALDFAAWQRLMEPACDELRAKAAAMSTGDVAAVARLRKAWDAPLVHAALQLVRARNKLQPKFPDRWRELVADPAGAEMATAHRVGAHKAQRFSRAGAGRGVVDLCCGIGGDAMALRAAGLDVLAVDRDPTRAWMAGTNAGCRSEACDVSNVPCDDRAFHIDPARRSAGRRVIDLDGLEPGVGVLAEIVRTRRDGGIKLHPGVDASELAVAGIACEIEVISDDGRLVQAVAWTGALGEGPDRRTATIVHRDGSAASLRGLVDVSPPPVSAMGRFIHELDPSVERAGLLTAVCERLGAPMAHPALGLLTSDAVIRDPFVTSFEVLDRFAWKLPRAKDKLRNLGAGIVEVKTRDKQVDPDAVQRELSRPGEGPTLTLLVLRFGREVSGIVARRTNPEA